MTLGIIIACIGYIIAEDAGKPVTSSIWFFVGIGVLVLGIFMEVLMRSTMSRIRSEVGEVPDSYYEE